jgi:hypothetical protein
MQGRKKDLKEFGILASMWENSKYASEYPENVEVKELPRFNAVGKRRIKCLKKQVFMSCVL